MSLNQLMQAFSALPQVMDSLKKMTVAEKEALIDQLALAAEERDVAWRILSAFQEGTPLSAQDQMMALGLLEKALKENKIDLSEILKNLQK